MFKKTPKKTNQHSPSYIWINSETDEEVIVNRIFADYQIPPTDEEVSETQAKQTGTWQRIIRGVSNIKAYSGKKGHW